MSRILLDQDEQRHAPPPPPLHSPRNASIEIPHSALLTGAILLSIVVVGYLLIRACKQWISVQLAMYGALRKADEKRRHIDDDEENKDADDKDNEDEEEEEEEITIRKRKPKKRMNY